MFAGTIRSNLQLGVERTLADAELEEALCLDLATRCPIDSIPIWEWERRCWEVGSSDWRFCNPSILLLDEATSALDSENQEKFLTVLKAWRDSSVSDGTSFEQDYGYHLHGSRWCDSG